MVPPLLVPPPRAPVELPELPVFELPELPTLELPEPNAEPLLPLVPPTLPVLTGTDLAVPADVAPVETAGRDTANVGADRVGAGAGAGIVFGFGSVLRPGGAATDVAVTTDGAWLVVLAGARRATLA